MDTQTPAPVTKRSGKPLKRLLAFLGVTLLCVLIVLLGVIWVLEKGPSPTVTETFCRSVRETSALKWVPRLFLSEEEIDRYKSVSTEEEETAAVNTSLIHMAEIPPAEENNPGFELLDINEGTCKGKLMIVYDPKRVILGTSENFGKEPGLTLSDMAAKYDAVAGINAGGFNDENGRGNGSLPQGLVIKEGELIWGEDKGVYNMVGLDRDGVLRVGAMSGAEALEKGIQWGVSFVTYDGLSSTLVVNGERQNAKPGGGVNPRTAIGQREDGAILLLVLDGRGISSLGATIEDICDIMLKHGAVTVGNLDGGSSSAMVYGGALINNCASVVGPRRMPTAFLVMKEDQ